MSGTDISTLSYKELQALALRYRVPGNIKKQLLIEVLQAARRGNDREVDNLLADLRQARKKRIRKGKPTKLNLTSTPSHSPSYNMGDDYYNNIAQHRLPYQWVGAEEEISNRQEDPTRVPPYEEFRQFLLRRIQRDYQTYNNNNNNSSSNNNNEKMSSATTVDFSCNAESMRQNEIETKTSFVNGAHPMQGYAEPMTRGQFEYQILEDPNGNGNASVLLRRMLQAPVGADLGEIASPESGGCRSWPVDQPQDQNNILDNSDTLTANSDASGNDDSWPIGTEYCRFMNNVREQMFPHQTHITFNRGVQDVGQFCNGLPNDANNHYQILYTNDLPENQESTAQQWDVGITIDQGMNYALPRNQNSKGFPTGYYDENTAANYSTNRPLELHQQYSNEGCSTYSGNQNTAFDGNNTSTVAQMEPQFNHQHLVDNSVVKARTISAEMCYNQQFARQTNVTNNTFMKPSYPASYPMHTEQEHNYQSLPDQQLSLPSQPAVQTPRYFENQTNCNMHAEDLAILNRTQVAEQHQHFYKNSYHSENIQIEQRKSLNEIMEVPTAEPPSTGMLGPFKPRNTENELSNSALENIFNLNSYGYIDYSKIDQTSCIYCYTAPIVTQKVFSPNSLCSQRKRFMAEIRQHTFSPCWLLYNDAATGLQMAKLENENECPSTGTKNEKNTASSSHCQLKDAKTQEAVDLNSEQISNNEILGDCDYQLAGDPCILSLVKKICDRGSSPESNSEENQLSSNLDNNNSDEETSQNEHCQSKDEEYFESQFTNL